jgi:hypothetical protein
MTSDIMMNEILDVIEQTDLSMGNILSLSRPHILRTMASEERAEFATRVAEATRFGVGVALEAADEFERGRADDPPRQAANARACADDIARYGAMTLANTMLLLDLDLAS